MTHPIPEHIGSQLERADWEPKEALQFYADGNHFDVVDGKTRILDTGGIASNALKSLSIDRLELKGDAELHELREKVIAQQARITELETTPPDKREDLRCVISDLCHQVRERDEKIVAQQARIEQLRSLLFNAHGVFDDGEDIGNDRLIVSFGVADTLCDQIEEALEFQDDLSALRAHDAKLLAPYQWQPIETAPKDGEVILVSHVFNDQIYWVEAAKQKHGAWFRPTGHAVHQPTHWMPLPSTEAIEKGGV